MKQEYIEKLDEVESLKEKTKFSKRELEVGLLRQAGKQHKDIATELEIGEGTVNTYLNRINKKLERAENTINYVKSRLPDKEVEKLSEESFLSETEVKLLKEDGSRAYFVPELASKELTFHVRRKDLVEASDINDVDGITRKKRSIRDKYKQCERMLELLGSLRN